MITLLEVRKVHINSRKSKVEALKGINLELPSKGFVSVVGDNGSGKTTLLSIIGGLDTVTSGKLLVNGKDFANAKQKQLDDWRGQDVAFVFQDNNVLAAYSVADNIRIGKALAGEQITNEELSDLLKKVRLAGFESRCPNDLSGGERQKVAVARALAKQSKIILVDEPTAQADEQSTISLMEILKEVSKHVLVVCVSHNSALVKKYADRVVELKKGLIVGDATVKRKGDAELPTNDDIWPQHRKAFSTKAAMKMGAKNFYRNWAKAFLAVFITTLSLAFFASSIMLSGFSSSKVLSEDAHGLHPYYIFTASSISSESIAQVNPVGTYTAYVGEHGIQGIIEAPANASTDQDIFGRNVYLTRPGFSFYGAGNNEIIITDHLLQRIARANSLTEGEVVNGTRTLKLFGQDFIISGAVRTDYQTYRNAPAGTAEHDLLMHKITTEYAVVFVAPGFVSEFVDLQEANLFPTTKLLFSADITEGALVSLITTATKVGDLRFESVNSSTIYSFAEKVYLFETTFLVFALLSLLISAIFLYTFVTNLITDYKKDIGILRSLGARASTIYSTFFTTVGIIAAIGIVCTIATMFGAAAVMNAVATNYLGFTTTIASVGILNVLAVLGLCVLTAFFATFLPIFKYSHQAPIKQIKR
jgi:ABC-type lipoprotein export system ATPase subunit/ABC-type antimicrobial peptide transport system permease subunit